MGEFVIGTTDFGIDLEAVIFDLVSEEGTPTLLTVEFEGRQDEFDRILQEQNEQWGWASFPPSFYLRDFPIPMAGPTSVVTVHIARNAYRTYEVAIYLMEHNTVEATITITGGQRIEITGQIELLGQLTQFHINWGNPAPNQVL
jgi:hypothetical protein